MAGGEQFRKKPASFSNSLEDFLDLLFCQCQLIWTIQAQAGNPTDKSFFPCIKYSTRANDLLQVVLKSDSLVAQWVN